MTQSKHNNSHSCHAQNIPFTDAVRLQLYKMANSPKTVPPFISPNTSPSLVTSRRPSEKNYLIITRCALYVYTGLLVNDWFQADRVTWTAYQTYFIPDSSMHEEKILFSLNVTKGLRVIATFTLKLGSLTTDQCFHSTKHFPVRIWGIFQLDSSYWGIQQNSRTVRRTFFLDYEDERSLLSTN